MPRPENVPELPFEKPEQLVELETLGPDRLSAMTPTEAHERMQEAAYALAYAYRKKACGNQEGCVLTVSSALAVTGGAINTKVGVSLVAESNQLAQEACAVVYTDDTLEY